MDKGDSYSVRVALDGPFFKVILGWNVLNKSCRAWLADHFYVS